MTQYSLMYKRNRHYTEPCGIHNSISYKSYCQLGAINNPALYRIDRDNGSFRYSTYHLRKY